MLLLQQMHLPLHPQMHLMLRPSVGLSWVLPLQQVVQQAEKGQQLHQRQGEQQEKQQAQQRREQLQQQQGVELQQQEQQAVVLGTSLLLLCKS